MRTAMLLSLAAAALAPSLAAAQTPSCAHTVGVVVELTGAAGRFGQAAAKSVELAFRELNEGGAGGSPAAGSPSTCATRRARARSRSTQARQLVDLKQVPAIIGGIISSVSIPIAHVGDGAGRRGADLARLLLADAHPLARGGQGQRHLLPHHHLRRAAGHGGGEVRDRPGHEEARRSSTSTTISASTWWPSSASAYEALGGEVTTATPYNQGQASYAARGHPRPEGRPAGALPRRLSRATAPPSPAPGSPRGARRRFLLNDGMNRADFIRDVGPRYLEQGVRHLVRHHHDAVDRVFRQGLPRHVAAASTPARRPPTGPTTRPRSWASPSRRPARRKPAAIRDAIRKVTEPRGEVVHAGPEGLQEGARADQGRQAGAAMSA